MFLNRYGPSSPLTASPAHSLYSTLRFSWKIRPRSACGTPTASNSFWYQPAATPSVSRPRDIWSIDAVTLARTVGLRSGRTSTPVPSRRRSVDTASAASVLSESRTGNGVLDPSRTWSQTQAESSPSPSARLA